MNKIKFIAALMIISSPVFAGDTIEEFNGISIEVSDFSTEVSLSLSGQVKYHLFRVSDPPRLVVEMINTANRWEEFESGIDHILLAGVRSGQYRSEPVRITRAVIELNTLDYNFTEKFEDNKIRINVSINEDSPLRLRERVEPEKEKSIEEKKESAEPKTRPDIKPNIPTQEHLRKVDEIRAARAQRKEIKEEEVETEEKPDTAAVISGSLVGSLSDEIVDFNFVNADILDVLRTFAYKLGKNIIPAENVSGSITLRLRSVPFDEAFNMLLDRRGLVAIQRSPNVIEVLRREMMPTERRTFNLRSRSASDIMDTLEGLMTDEEKANTTLAMDRASNSLIINATPAVLSRLERLVDQMDIKSPQIKIKTRIIEVQAGDTFDSAISWAANIPFTGTGVQQIRGVQDRANYTIDPTDQSINFDGAISQQSFARGGLLDISAVIDDTSLYGLLNLLSTKMKSKTISEPTILTENNKSANIHVGRNLPVRTTRVTETGTTQSVEFITEGVTLDVTPVVSPGSDQIALNVDVSLTDFVGFQADSPITQGRSARTEVTVESGKTIIIGGLIRETDLESDSGIPVLKDIPLLGYLFKNTTQSKERTELLVFLSPEIIKD